MYNFNSFIATQRKILFKKMFETNFRIFRLLHRKIFAFFPLFFTILPVFILIFE